MSVNEFFFTIGEVLTIKMCEDKKVMESSGCFYSYRTNVNFQTVLVGLASLFISLYWDEFDIKGVGRSKKFFGEIQLCFASQWACKNTLIMRHFIELVLTLKSVAFNLGLIIECWGPLIHVL